MASFVNSNLGSDSDSGDDQDFDPTKESGHVVSEEENSGDDKDVFHLTSLVMFRS